MADSYHPYQATISDVNALSAVNVPTAHNLGLTIDRAFEDLLDAL